MGADAAHVAEASSVGLAIELERVPVQAGVAAVAAAAGVDPVDLATASGEDYELLATIPADRVSETRAGVTAAGVALSLIGEVVAGSAVELRDRRGVARPPGGFDQLRLRRGPDDRA